MPRFRAYAAHQKDGAVAALGVRLGEIGPEHVDIDVHSCGICHSNSACWTSTLLLACCSRPSRRRPGHSVFRRRSRHPIDRREAAGGSIAHVTRIRCGGRLARDDGAIMLMLPSLAPTAPPCATRAPRRGSRSRGGPVTRPTKHRPVREASRHTRRPAAAAPPRPLPACRGEAARPWRFGSGSSAAIRTESAFSQTRPPVAAISRTREKALIAFPPTWLARRRAPLAPMPAAGRAAASKAHP